MEGKLRHYTPLQAPYINVKVKVISSGSTNGKPNIKEEDRYMSEKELSLLYSKIYDKHFNC